MNETFILMSREAVEIQEGWDRENPEIGQIYYDPVWQKCFAVNWHHEDFGELPYVWRDVFFIPRQKDLQEIYFEIKGKESRHYMGLLGTFYAYIYNEFFDASKFLDESFDFNMMWLCFIMETCYQKRWNGKTWEAIK